MPINQTANVTSALVEAYGIATEKRHEFLTPEHLLAGYLKDRDFWDIMSGCGRPQELEDNLYKHINGMESVPEDMELAIEFSAQLQEVFERAAETAASAMVGTVQTHHVIYSYFHLEDSYARFHLESCLESGIPDFLNSLIGLSEEAEPMEGEPQPDEKWIRYFRPVEPDADIIGRKEETERILRIFCRRTKNKCG